MPRKKVLLTVTTYPLPSRSYDELVCTAGILENGAWIRIYPVPLSFLRGQRETGEMESFKFNNGGGQMCSMALTWIGFEAGKSNSPVFL